MKFRALLFALAGVVWSFMPLAASAALVPCGFGSDPTTTGALSCDLCSVGQLIQNIVNFLVGISIPISVLMFGWAGVLMLTSAEDPLRLARGKKIFQSVFIGFVIVISGWLVIQTILSVLVDQQFYIGGRWNNLECANPKIREDRTNISVGTFIDNILGKTPQVQPSVNFESSCRIGSVYDPEAQNCYNPSTKTRTGPIPFAAGGTLSPAALQAQLVGTQQYGAQLKSICAREGLSNCSLAQAVMAIESGGRARCSSMNACGLMQVIPSTAKGLDPSLNGLSDAQIRQRLNSDPNLGITLGVRYIKQMSAKFNTLPEVIAAYNGGPDANRPSVSCPGQKVWECSKNSRYAETRKYVPNVMNTLSLLP